MTSRIASRLAPVLMVQGTSSHAGKSTLVAALCRLFDRAGCRVAPFKAQNMSNNAAVTDDGREVGRAQAMQAAAARTPVTVDMNPVLLKPQSDRTSQVVVLGRPTRALDARQYYDRTAELWPVVTGALDRLRAEFDVVVVEGAGSPAEINLERYDIVNMRVARYANAPVLLVGDIDRGGVFASLFGTWALLPELDRSLIRGYVINKFRGDPSLLDSGFGILEERTGIPTLGVLPYLDLSRLPAEDALEWERLHQNAHEHPTIDVAIARLPRVANLDEFQPLAAEPGVAVRFVGEADELGSPDLIIVPGTKSTIADLRWLRARGLADAIARRSGAGTPVLGICGGFQMLGEAVTDELEVEASGSVRGLGLLPVTTSFAAEKITERVAGRTSSASALWPAGIGGLDAYEIHMGRTSPIESATCAAAFHVRRRRDGTAAVETLDGITSRDGRVVGTYLHGLLENESLRRAMLRSLARRKGVVFAESPSLSTVDDAIDALADSVAGHLDLGVVGDLVGLPLGARV